MWRRQLPAWSPVTLEALVAGAAASNRSDRHRTDIKSRIRSDYGTSAVRLTESGTAALALAILAAAPEGTRPRVAMPAWGCYDLMTAADIADAEVMLYDLDATNLSPSPSSFADVLRLRPAAVVIAHWFGLPVSLTPLVAAAHKAGAFCIEDAAQGVGGRIGDRPLGSLGDFGILSFGRGKGRTGGAGGAVLANTEEAAALLHRAEHRVLPAAESKAGLAALAAQWALGRPWLYAAPSAVPFLKLGETIYHPATPIREMPEWAAAAAAAVWERSAAASAARRAAADVWAKEAPRTDAIRTFSVLPGATAGWLRYPILVCDPAALRDGRARRLGIMPGYEQILAALPVGPGRLVSAGPWPGAADLAARLRTLPSHGLVRSADVRAIVGLLKHLEPSQK